MSNHLTSEAYKRQVGSMARKAVLVLMADKASDDGSGIWASKQRMADEIGTSKQTVIATIKSLIVDGIIAERGQRRCANGYTVEYAINVRALKALPFVKWHEDDQSSELTGQVASPVKHDDPTSQAALPDQSSELTGPVKLLDPNLPEPPLTPQEPEEVISPAGEPTLTVSEIVDGWNDLATRCGLAKVAKLTDARKRKAAAQAKRYSVADWLTAFSGIERSAFLRGTNDRGWRADFDFILSDSSFVKILEGKYDPQPSH